MGGSKYRKYSAETGIQKFFGLTDDDVAKVLTAKKSEKELGTQEPSMIKLDRYFEKDINMFAEKLDWKGTGTENDPIIIPNSEGLPQKFSISIANLYIKILDCKFEHIILYNCRNILIENCSFNILGVFKSSKISVKNSNLSNLNLNRCYNSYFKECSITKALNLRSQANVFENCTITNKVRKTLQESPSELSKFLKQWPLVIIVAGFGFAVFTFIYIFNSIPFGLYWYLSIITFIILIIIYPILSKNQKKYTNKIISNENFKKNLL